MLALSGKAAAIAREANAKSQEQPKKTQSKPKKGGKDWLDEMVTKQEIIDRVGIIDPIIQPKIESTLSSLSYAGKTKAEVSGELVNDLEKQIEKLKYQRVKMLQDQQKTSQRGQAEEEIVPEDPEEVAFQKAMRDKDTDKLQDIVDKRRAKLDELERRWREKKEMGQMREAGLLDSDNYKQLHISQKSGPSKLYSEYSNRPSSPARVTASSKPTTGAVATRNYQDRPLTQALTSSQSDVMQEDGDLKDLLKKSEKLRAIDPRRTDFERKVSDYLVSQGLKKNTEEYFKTMEKKKFEKFTSPTSLRKTQQDQEKFSGSPISHLPIREEKPEKENRQANIPENKVNKRKVREINELFIIKLVFDALNHENKGIISKDEVVDYVLTNQDVVTLFDLKSSFSTEVLTFPSEKVGFLNFQEFSQLMMKRLPQKTQKEIKSAFQFEPEKKPFTQPPEPGHQDMLLKQEEIDILNGVFSDLDQYEDLLIKTEDYLNALRADIRVQKMIKKPAIKIPVVDRELTIGEILDQIETDMTTAMENGTNTMQYISWNQFMDYFKTYKASKFTRGHPHQNQNQEEEEEEGMLLSEGKLQVLQDVFDMLPRVAEDYVDKIEFVKAAKRDPQVNSFWKEQVDTTNEKTVGDIFDKILAGEVNYLKWEEVLPFFSRSGVTEKTEDDYDEQPLRDSPTQINKGEFPTFAPDHISEAAKEDESREGDSRSPERSPVAKERGKAKEFDIKTKKPVKAASAAGNKRNKTYEPTNYDELDAELRKEYEMLQEDLRAYGVVKKNMKDEKGLTVPKPFKFTSSEAKSIRKQKVEQMVEEKRKEEEDAVNFKFRATEIPAYVKVPMYGTITKAQEERRMEVTEKSKQMTLANQKPFSFYERDQNKEKKAVQEQTFSQFKANPVPQFAKTEIMKDKEEQDKKSREERIKQRMENNAMSSKLPPRMEMHEKAKTEGAVSKVQNPNKYKEEELNFRPKVNKDVPDFDQLQKGFESSLQKKKKEMPKTQFKPFGFQQKEESLREASVSQQESQTKNTKKPAQKKLARQGTATGKQKPPAKKPQRQEEEEEEQQQQEEEYPQDEDQAGGEDNEEAGSRVSRQGKSNADEEGEEEKGGEGEEGNFFEIESQGAADEAMGPQPTHTKPPPAKKKKEMEETSQKSENLNKSARSMQNTGGSVKGEEKKKPFMTKKLEQEFERRKQGREAIEKREADKKKEDQDRKTKEKEFAPKVVNAYKEVNKVDKREEENKQRVKDSRDRMRREQQDYDERIKEMKTKVDSAPLMIENKLYGSRFLKKYREAMAKGWINLEGPEQEAAQSEQSEAEEPRRESREDSRQNRLEKRATGDSERGQKRGSSSRNVNRREEQEEENYEQKEESNQEKQDDVQEEAEEIQEDNAEPEPEENNEEQEEEPKEAGGDEENNENQEEAQEETNQNEQEDEQKEATVEEANNEANEEENNAEEANKEEEVNNEEGNNAEEENNNAGEENKDEEGEKEEGNNDEEGDKEKEKGEDDEKEVSENYEEEFEQEEDNKEEGDDS